MVENVPPWRSAPCIATPCGQPVSAEEMEFGYEDAPSPLRIDVITLLPQVFEAYWSDSMLGRAQQAGLLQCRAHQVRDFTHDKHHLTDDYPYGGGVGMVMKPEPIFRRGGVGARRRPA